jgi:predicted amidohydrolase YtcJ
LQPYADKPNWNGFLLHSIQHYDSVAHLLAASKFQMCTHAIGDSANRFILQLYQKYLSNNNNRRWRIEHAQVVHANDVALFKAYNIIPSMQPTHATSDMYWAESRLGNNRLPEAYALKTLMQQNGWIALGTDFPVEDINPFKTFYAAVFRKNAQGFPPNGFLSKEALTKEEALKGMTIWAAKAAFWENEIGSIEENKQADFIILNQDFLQATENKILQTKVIATYISGKKVYEAAKIN